ncbi:MAG: hypothetical protein ACO25K_05180 [Candidatus Fonsibacter ubiquis]
MKNKLNLLIYLTFKYFNKNPSTGNFFFKSISIAFIIGSIIIALNSSCALNELIKTIIQHVK